MATNSSTFDKPATGRRTTQHMAALGAPCSTHRPSAAAVTTSSRNEIKAVREIAQRQLPLAARRSAPAMLQPKLVPCKHGGGRRTTGSAQHQASRSRPSTRITRAHADAVRISVGPRRKSLSNPGLSAAKRASGNAASTMVVFVHLGIGKFSSHDNRQSRSLRISSICVLARIMTDPRPSR